jgi:hypothetical protein
MSVKQSREESGGRAIGWPVCLVGIWLFVSPFVLGIDVVRWSFWVALLTGLLLVVLGIAIAVSDLRWPGGAMAVASVWLLASAWILAAERAEAAAISSLATGLAVMVLSGKDLANMASRPTRDSIVQPEVRRTKAYPRGYFRRDLPMGSWIMKD